MRKLKANGKEEWILDPLKKIENSSTEKCTIHCKKIRIMSRIGYLILGN